MTVVDIGAGLDTRVGRMPGVADTYVEVDSQPIIGLREEWLPGTGAVRIVGDGMRVGEWITAVQALPPESVVGEAAPAAVG